jgi:hypothetical protein
VCFNPQGPARIIIIASTHTPVAVGVCAAQASHERLCAPLARAAADACVEGQRHRWPGQTTQLSIELHGGFTQQYQQLHSKLSNSLASSLNASGPLAGL